MQKILVEMDIINTPEVREVRASGVSLDGEEDEEGTAGPKARERRAALSDSFHLWPEQTVPYHFHAFVGKQNMLHFIYFYYFFGSRFPCKGSDRGGNGRMDATHLPQVCGSRQPRKLHLL